MAREPNDLSWHDLFLHSTSSDSEYEPESEPVSESESVTDSESEREHSQICGICLESKEVDQMFTIESCNHIFCTDCIIKHIETKIQENLSTVSCPGLDCKEILEPDACRSVIPKHVLTAWDGLICESMIMDSQKFYCPFKNCSAMLVKDSNEVIRESECPICRRLFCAQCRTPWHSGIECAEFQSLNEDEREREDLMLRNLAEANNWKRCPRCKFYVEKNEGCLHMTCRSVSLFTRIFIY